MGTEIIEETDIGHSKKRISSRKRVVKRRNMQNRGSDEEFIELSPSKNKLEKVSMLY